MVRKIGILVVCLIVSFVLIVLALFNFNFSNDFITGDSISNSIEEISDNSQDILNQEEGVSFVKDGLVLDREEFLETEKDFFKKIKKTSHKGSFAEDKSREYKEKKIILEEYKSKEVGKEELFFDKKFHDNGRYVVNSLNEYSAEWYPDDSPKKDLKKLTIELQVTDKVTGSNFSIKGTADIPKYYSGHFDFNTSLENLVSFEGINPEFVWEYSEDSSIVYVKKKEERVGTEDKLKTETYVKEKEFKNYKPLDKKLKESIPKGLFLDPNVSACGTLSTAGATFNLINNVSSSTTCFTITNPNITLDCHKYWITYSTGSGNPYYGVYSDEVNTTIKNCNIYSANRTTGYWYSAGIQLQAAHNSTLINNYVNTVSSQGIMFGSTNYSSLIFNRAVTSYSQGIRLDYSSYNYLVNNTGETLNNEGTGFTWGARYNVAINHTSVGNDERGTYFSYDSNYNLLINPNSTGEYAFQFSNSSHNTIIDCVYIGGDPYDVYHASSSLISVNNTFINCSYDNEYVHSSNSINRKWHYGAYVNYTNGSAANGATITATNTTGHTQFSVQTNSSGLIFIQNVTEYVNRGGTRTFYNNYNITASKSGFIQDTNTFNFSLTQNKVNDFFTLGGGDNTTLSFTDIEDTYIASGAPTTNYGTSVAIGVDGSPYERGLIKFTNIFGDGEGQIPLGSIILDANLTLYNDNDAGNNPIVYIMRSNWTELQATWNANFTGNTWTTAGVYSTDCDTSISASTTLGTANTYSNINVTSFVQNWSNGAPNYGFLIYEGGTSGITISSSEDTESQRPVLTIKYLPGSGDISSPVITFESPTPSNTSSTTSPVTIVADISDESNTTSFIDFDNTLLLWLSMEGNALDNSSYNWSTSNGGATFTDGKFGQSLTGFTSTNKVTVDSDLDFASTDMTISFWMYVINGAVPNRQNPIGKAYGGDGTFTLEPSGTITFFWGSYGGDSTPYDSDSSPAYTNGTWEHWVIVRDRTGRTTQWYKNGVADSPESYTSTYDPVHSSNDLEIGDDYVSPLNGSIDEIMIFNRTLSSTEIKALYSSQINKFNTSEMDLSTGQHDYTVYAIDESGNQASSGERNFIVTSGATSCGTLDAAGTTYTLSGNVSSTDTCFEVTAANVTLDCNGYWINYSTGGAASTYGVYSNQFNTTVKNCNIIQGNRVSANTDREGIFFNSAENGTIFRNWVNTSNSISIRLVGSDYNNLTSNVAESYSSSGIDIHSGLNNILVENNGTSISGTGIYLVSYSNNTVLLRNNGVGRGSNPGIYVYSSLFNNLTENKGVSLSGSGIILDDDSNNCILMSNNATSYASGFFGLYLTESSNNILINNTGRNPLDGIGIYLGGASNNNTLINNTGITTTGQGIYIYNNANNTLINQRASGGLGVFIINTNWTTFRDCIDLSGSSFDVQIHSLALSINNTFINCSYDTEAVGGTSNELIRKWYYMAYVNDSSGNAVADANILATNTTGQTQFSVQTNSTGHISRQEVIEYVNNGGTRSFYNNYTLTASKTGYSSDVNTFNFTITQNKLNDFFTLGSADPDELSITFESPTPSNTSSTSPNVRILANISGPPPLSSWIDFDRTLVGYWSMDYYNSTGIYDNSTWNNFAVFEDGAGIGGIKPGIRGNALEFYGNSSDISSVKLGASTAATFDTPGEITLAAWIRPDVISWQGIMGTENVRFHLNSGPQLKATMYYSNDTRVDWYMSASLVANAWQHVALTYDRTDGNLSVYLNGTIIGSRTYNGLDLSYSSDNFRIGDNWGDYFDGLIDEAMAFNRTLSPSEVKALYDSKNNKFDASFTGLSAGYHNYTVYAIDEDMNRVSVYRNFLVSGTSISSCQNLNTANTIYYLSNNISSTGTCITVLAQNITIDCQGYRITYSSNGGNGEYGITSDYFNTTIRNCHILDGNFADDQWTPSILLNDGANYSTIYNNFINGESISLWLANTWNVNVSNNIFFVPSGSMEPVYIEGAVNNTFVNNNLTSIGDYALRISYYTYPSRNNLFMGNKIYSSNTYAAYIDGSTYNTFINNTLISGSTSANAALGLYDDTISSDYNTFINNTIRGYRGVFLSNAEYNNFVGNNITATYNGMNIDTSSNNLFRDCVSFSGTTYDFYTQNAATNNTFINCSFTLSKGVVNSGGAITNKWYYRAYANYSNSTPAAGVNISINNSAGPVGSSGGWSDELVSNPSFESGLTGWTTSSGSGETWYSSTGTIGHNTTAYDGSYAATCTYCTSSTYIYQDVDISAYATQIDAGTARVNASGYLQSAELPPQDWVRLQIMYLNSGMSVIETSLNTGNLGVYPWTRYGIYNDVPPVGARYVRVWGNTYETCCNSGTLDKYSVMVYTPPSPLVTDGTGWIPRQELTEYTNSAGTRTYYNNYTMNATLNTTLFQTITHIFNFTIQQNKINDFFTFNVSGTCTYSSGNWYINCSEGCNITSNYDVGGNNITIVGYGTVTVSSNVSNYNKLHIEGLSSSNICTVRCINGGCFKS